MRQNNDMLSQLKARKLLKEKKEKGHDNDIFIRILERNIIPLENEKGGDDNV